MATQGRIVSIRVRMLLPKTVYQPALVFSWHLIIAHNFSIVFRYQHIIGNDQTVINVAMFLNIGFFLCGENKILSALRHEILLTTVNSVTRMYSLILPFTLWHGLIFSSSFSPSLVSVVLATTSVRSFSDSRLNEIVQYLPFDVVLFHLTPWHHALWAQLCYFKW